MPGSMRRGNVGRDFAKSRLDQARKARKSDQASILPSGVKDPRNITPAEFEIIEVLWEGQSPLSVGQVLQSISRRRPLAYTTVMTLLDKMARKGSVNRSKQGKAYYYRPSVRRSQVVDYLLDNFVDAYCGGEKTRLARFLEPAASAGGRTSRAASSDRAGGNPAPDLNEPEDMDVILL